eukprot:8208388-Pyramimonas_sp.AAC.1
MWTDVVNKTESTKTSDLLQHHIVLAPTPSERENDGHIVHQEQVMTICDSLGDSALQAQNQSSGF